MKYIALVLTLLGLFLLTFKDFIKFKNYYLGRYFNKVLGFSLVVFNLISLIVSATTSKEYFDIIFPIIIGIVSYKIKEKEFDYFLIKDDYYESKGGEKPIRNTVRGIVLNEKNEVGFIHIDFDDPLFGYRDHYELPGGGIEKGEDKIEAVKREMEEELGYTVKDIHYLTHCGIEYNPFNRIDDAFVYVCRVDEKTHTNFQGIENEFIKGIEFIPLKKIIDIYNNDKQDKVSKMIYERDGRLVKLFNSCK